MTKTSAKSVLNEFD